MVVNTNFMVVISVCFLILVITSINLEVLTLTNMEKIRCVFLENNLGFQQVFNINYFYLLINFLLNIKCIRLLIRPL